MSSEPGASTAPSGTEQTAPTASQMPIAPDPIPLFPPQPDLASSALPPPFPFPPLDSAHPFFSAELPTPPPVASTSTAPAGGAVDDPHPGFPTVSGFNAEREGYLDSLDQKKKRAKALVDSDMYNFVRSTLLHPQDTSLRTAQDRFWARATFTLARKGEEPNSASAAAKVLTSLSAAKPASPPPASGDAASSATAAADLLADLGQPIASTSTAPLPPAPAASTSAQSKAPRGSRRPGRPAVSTPAAIPLLTDSDGNPIPVDESQVVVIHDGLPVARREDIYEVLVECHRKMEHGGREKTFKEVRTKWSWVPKELVARFIKICPSCIANSTPGVKWRNQSSKKASGKKAAAKTSTSLSAGGAKPKKAPAKGKGKGKAKAVEPEPEEEVEDRGEDGWEGASDGADPAYDDEDAEGESVDEPTEEDEFVPRSAVAAPAPGSRIGTRASRAAAAGATNGGGQASPDASREGPSPDAVSPPPAKKAKAESAASKRRGQANKPATAKQPSPAGTAVQPLPTPASTNPSAAPLPTALSLPWPSFSPSPLPTSGLPLPPPPHPSTASSASAAPAAAATHLPHPLSIPSTASAPIYTPYAPFATGSFASSANNAYSAPSAAPFPNLQHPAYSAYNPSFQLPSTANGFPPSSAYGTSHLPRPPSTAPSYAPYPFPAYPQHLPLPPHQQQQQPLPQGNNAGAAAGALMDILRATEVGRAANAVAPQAWPNAGPLPLPMPPPLAPQPEASAAGPDGGAGGLRAFAAAVESLKRPFEDIMPLPLPPTAASAPLAAADGSGETAAKKARVDEGQK
ncbi:hypothetical protein JCM6882_007420 [Rhodosporidiobolus microsporus]